MKNKKYYLFEMKQDSLNVISILLLILMVILTRLLSKNFMIDFDNDYKWIMALMIPYFVLHEILHSISYVMHGAKFKNVVYGAHLEKGVFCCLCKQNISRKNILTSLLYPFFWIGVITYVIGMILNCNILVWLSILNISGCSGDLMMFYSLRKIKNFEYSEYDNPLAFGIYTSEDLSGKKLFGLKYVGSSNTLQRKDLKKITISKLSVIVLIVLFALIFALIFMENRTYNVGNISNVETKIIEENDHDKDDIEKVLNVIKKKFRTNDFKDCKLISIEYDNGNEDLEKELIEEYNAKDAIVLVFTFKTGSNPEIVFNPNSEYEYTASFIKDINDHWIKVNWGQG